MHTGRPVWFHSYDKRCSHKVSGGLCTWVTVYGSTAPINAALTICPAGTDCLHEISSVAHQTARRDENSQLRITPHCMAPASVIESTHHTHAPTRPHSTRLYNSTCLHTKPLEATPPQHASQTPTTHTYTTCVSVWIDYLRMRVYVYACIHI